MSRRFRLLLTLGVTVSACSFAIVACSTAAPRNNAINARDDVDSGKKRDGAIPDLPDPKPEEDPLLPDGGKPPGRVYAHTADTLYLFNPLTKSLKRIGVFACLAGDKDAGTSATPLLDIALDRDGVMYGTTRRGFLRIDPLDATCTHVRDDAVVEYPNSLAFVPIGTVDPTKETLVGYQYDPSGNFQPTVYVRIDLATGGVAKVGDLNLPDASVRYRSAGDLIALIRSGNKAYLTVQKIGDDAGTPSDYLAEIDPATGSIKVIVGDTKRQDLWGFGQWAGTGYAFSGKGGIFEIDMTTGAASPVTTNEGDDGGQAWYGAGVSTDSPTKP